MAQTKVKLKYTIPLSALVGRKVLNQDGELGTIQRILHRKTDYVIKVISHLGEKYYDRQGLGEDPSEYIQFAPKQKSKPENKSDTASHQDFVFYTDSLEDKVSTIRNIKDTFNCSLNDALIFYKKLSE